MLQSSSDHYSEDMFDKMASLSAGRNTNTAESNKDKEIGVGVGVGVGVGKKLSPELPRMTKVRAHSDNAQNQDDQPLSSLDRHLLMDDPLINIDAPPLIPNCEQSQQPTELHKPVPNELRLDNGSLTNHREDSLPPSYQRHKPVYGALNQGNQPYAHRGAPVSENISGKKPTTRVDQPYSKPEFLKFLERREIQQRCRQKEVRSRVSDSLHQGNQLLAERGRRRSKSVDSRISCQEKTKRHCQASRLTPHSQDNQSLVQKRLPVAKNILQEKTSPYQQQGNVYSHTSSAQVWTDPSLATLCDQNYLVQNESYLLVDDLKKMRDEIVKKFYYLGRQNHESYDKPSLYNIYYTLQFSKIFLTTPVSNEIGRISLFMDDIYVNQLMCFHVLDILDHIIQSLYKRNTTYVCYTEDNLSMEIIKKLSAYYGISLNDNYQRIFEYIVYKISSISVLSFVPKCMGDYTYCTNKNHIHYALRHVASKHDRNSTVYKMNYIIFSFFLFSLFKENFTGQLEPDTFV